jgi:predicted transposase
MFVSLQFKLELKKEDREKLIKLMRKQSSAIRTAYNMLRELEREKTKKSSHPNIPKTETAVS